MTSRIQKLFELAMDDSEFYIAMQDGESANPKEYTDELGKHLVAMCYWGWCIAKGTTEEIKSKLPSKNKCYQL